MPTVVLGYNLLLVAVLVVSGMLAADSNVDRLIALSFIPMALYFTRQIKSQISRGESALAVSPSISKTASKISTSVTGEVVDGQELSDAEVADLNKRLFIKLIGSAGLATFTFAMFTKRAQASFFGSMPVPGTVSLEDSSGNTIDPAEKEPTDGYEINDVDDDVLPSYYGFVDKDGNWYITKEDTDGSFRYIRGATDYSTNWTGRAGLSYDYFNNVF